MASMPPTYYDADDVYDSMNDTLLAIEETTAALDAGTPTDRAPTGEAAAAMQYLKFLFAEMQGEWMQWGLTAETIAGRFPAAFADYLNTSDLPATRWRPASFGGKAAFTAVKDWADARILAGQNELISVQIIAECGERAAAQMDDEGGTNNSAYTIVTRALLGNLPAL